MSSSKCPLLSGLPQQGFTSQPYYMVLARWLCVLGFTLGPLSWICGEKGPRAGEPTQQFYRLPLRLDTSHLPKSLLGQASEWAREGAPSHRMALDSSCLQTGHLVSHQEG